MPSRLSLVASFRLFSRLCFVHNMKQSCISLADTVIEYYYPHNKIYISAIFYIEDFNREVTMNKRVKSKSESPESFQARKTIFSSSVFKDREVYNFLYEENLCSY